jgi:flagellar hook-basal body complex protein FliE
MSNKQLKERKKKNKERETRAKLLARRLNVAHIKKREREVDRDVRAMRERIMPVINPDKDKLRKQKQLEHNLQLLKSLEEEYKREQEARKKINERLEAQGALTFQEKMDMMGKEVTEAAKKAEEKSESLIEKTNKVLSKVRAKEIMEGEVMQENWEKRRKTFRETLAGKENNENSEENTKDLAE